MLGLGHDGSAGVEDLWGGQLLNLNLIPLSPACDTLTLCIYLVNRLPSVILNSAFEMYCFPENGRKNYQRLWIVTFPVFSAGGAEHRRFPGVTKDSRSVSLSACGGEGALAAGEARSLSRSLPEAQTHPG